MLVGPAGKNAILIVEFAKMRRDEGLSAAEAAGPAARLRFRTVTMTPLSFILGVLLLVFASGAGAASRTWPRPCALVFHANQDPALVHVFFSTCTANVPQLFPDIVHDKAEALGVPVAEIFPVIQAGFGSPCVHLVHWLILDRRRVPDGDNNLSEPTRTCGAPANHSGRNPQRPAHQLPGLPEGHLGDDGDSQVADVVDIARQTLVRRKRQGVLRRDEGDRAAMVTRMFNRALSYFDGNREHALDWLKHPHPALAGETPLERADTATGAEDVIDLIGRLEHGIPA